MDIAVCLATAIKTELHDLDRLAVYASALKLAGDPESPGGNRNRKTLLLLFMDDPVYLDSIGELVDEDDVGY